MLTPNEIIEASFQWCCVELDAKCKAEHSRRWGRKLDKVREHNTICRTIGLEALKQWETLLKPSFLDGMWYPKDVEDGFNKEAYLEHRLNGEALDYVIKKMRDFIMSSEFDKDDTDTDKYFTYNNMPLEY